MSVYFLYTLNSAVENQNQSSSGCLNFKNVLQLKLRVHSFHIITCVTVLNSNTSDNCIAFYCREDSEALNKNNNNNNSLSHSPPSSALPSSWVIQTSWCFFKYPWEDLYSIRGPGCCFLNIYKPLDRGSWVLDRCPCCPMAEKMWTAPWNPHCASVPLSDTQGQKH